MKLRTVGTGSITGQSLDASTLIDGKILVDCGSGIVKAIPEQYLMKIKVLLITHLHGDHFLDTIFLILRRSFNPVANKLVIYGPADTERVIRETFALAYPSSNLDAIFAKANIQFMDSVLLNETEIIPEYSVTSYEVKHGEIAAYGFIVEHDNVRVGFSGDSAYCENIDNIIKASNAVVLDANFLVGDDTHMGVDTIERLAKKYPKAILIPTHMKDEGRQALCELGITNLIIPKDGQEIVIEHSSML